MHCPSAQVGQAGSALGQGRVSVSQFVNELLPGEYLYTIHHKCRLPNWIVLRRFFVFLR